MREDPSAEQAHSQLVWRNLTLTVGKDKVLIDNVSGIAKGGRVMSLMGPSGAGWWGRGGWMNTPPY